MRELEFWYDFASTYSYLSAMRIEELASKAGVTVRWRPFLLGPIFAAQGWTTSPFNLYPAKGRHMWRDMERECSAAGLSLRRPEPFPQNGLLAARVALIGLQEGWGETFSRAVFAAEFGEGRTIAERGVVAEILLSLGRNPEPVLAAAQEASNKARLKAQCEEAAGRGVFGAPTFITGDGELFWGNDRLERALAWPGCSW